MSRRHSNGHAGRGVNRRNFLKASAASAFLFGAGAKTAHAETGALANPSQGGARNIIFLVSDGMSMGTLTAAEHMLQRKEGRESHWGKLYRERSGEVRRGVMDMAPLNSIVTDSAAAASSWGCGHRIMNGALNMSPDGEPYPTILEHFRDAGKGTGLVTTTRITHATPSGFSINMESRGQEDEIAAQYAERDYDLLMGGGNRHFDPDMRGDGEDIYARFEAEGYHVVRNKEGMNNLPADGKVLGIYDNSHLPYTLDHVNTPNLLENVPTLAEMTEAALERLSGNGDGFLLQVEGGRVDHAAHSNDVGGLIYDQIAFDDAVGVALAFQEEHPDTLVIITTDHGNANPGLNAAGSGYERSNTDFDRIQNFTHTNNWILGGLNSDSSVPDIIERVEEATAIEINETRAGILQDALRGDHDAVYGVMSGSSPTLGQILANYTSFNWIGTVHTADYVELCATGPGSEAIGAFTRNTALFDVMLESAGVDRIQTAKRPYAMV